MSTKEIESFKNSFFKILTYQIPILSRDTWSLLLRLSAELIDPLRVPKTIAVKKVFSMLKLRKRNSVNSILEHMVSAKKIYEWLIQEILSIDWF